MTSPNSTNQDNKSIIFYSFAIYIFPYFTLPFFVFLGIFRSFSMVIFRPCIFSPEIFNVIEIINEFVFRNSSIHLLKQSEIPNSKNLTKYPFLVAVFLNIPFSNITTKVKIKMSILILILC